MLTSYFDLNFDVIHAATGNRYADGNNIRLVTLGPIALFSFHKLKTSSAKHPKNIGHAYIVALIYKFLASAKDTDDLSRGFDRDRVK